MTSRRRGALAMIPACLLSSIAIAADRTPTSGVYDALLLGVDPASGALSGYVHADWIGAGTAAAPQFTCSFAFSGVAGEPTIVAWSPGGPIIANAPTLSGRISLKAETLTVTLQTRPGGCQYLMGDDASFDQDLSARHDWRAVRVVRNARAYFYDAPDERTRRKSFVVRDDGVGVLRSQAGWAEAEFVSDKSTTRGWMKTDDFYPDAPPTRPAPATQNASPRASLADFLRAYVKAQQGAPDKETRYVAADVRLKDGDKDQTLVYLMGGDWCGSGGCTLLVLDQDGAAYKLSAAISPLHPPVRVLSTQHDGWRDLGVWVGGGGIVHGYEATLAYDGKAYPDNPTTVRAKSAPQAGQQIFSGNETGAPLFP